MPTGFANRTLHLPPVGLVLKLSATGAAYRQNVPPGCPPSSDDLHQHLSCPRLLLSTFHSCRHLTEVRARAIERVP